MSDQIRCAGCSVVRDVKPTARGDPRLPRGWKRSSDGTFCGDCWGKRYVLRAVTFPVVGPEGSTWPELREALARAWVASTSLANWALTELYRNDVVRLPGQEKMPTMPTVYLYGLAGKRYAGWGDWAGCYASAQSLLHVTERKYREVRYAVVWTHSATLPTQRYPVPFPVHNQNWTASFDAGNRPLVVVALPGGRFTLRLKSGADMGRQLAALRQIVSGEATQGELALYRVRTGPAGHGNGVSESGDGGPRAVYRVMCKMVAWLPRKPPGERTHTLLLRTDPYALWVAELEGRQPWILNADVCRKWVAEHLTYLQRIAEDTKFEKRWPAEKRAAINAAREVRCQKNHNRVTSYIQLASKLLAEYAARNKVATVIYDDERREYLPKFSWHRLKELLRYKLDERGIKLIAKDEPDEPTGEE